MRIPGSKAPDRGGSVDRTRSSSAKASGETAASDASKGARANVTASVSAKAKTLAAEHGIDVDKVQQLRAAINDGSFQMDFKLIADRIVQEGA
ncbi:MAG: flagellar biosynthesis anti-sigma factor FlgM [Deltaproteobacteria bacterium]|nr:flagellar biosynthesis anti-sigma factor FlgM [Deltaproteobacteria bacterium]